jgi:ferric-dicitrate binding protein FerR (iron transport regulator)
MLAIPSDHGPMVADHATSSAVTPQYSAASAVRADVGAAESGQAYHSNSEETVHLSLPDWDAVTMAPNSALRVNYGTDAGNLQLAGEAIFESGPDSRRPFSVRAGKVKVVGNGAIFAVSARTGVAPDLITVARGTVTVSDVTSRWELVLHANEQARLVRTARGMPYEKISLTPALVKKAMSWRSKQFNFVGMTGTELTEAMSVVAQHSDIRAEVDPQLAGRKIRARVTVGNISAFLRFLKNDYGITAFRPDPQDRNVIQLVPEARK